MDRSAAKDMIVTEAPLLQPGEHVETLEILSVLGRGRHGPMYVAKDPEIGVVAVKEYAPCVNGPRRAGVTAEDIDSSSAVPHGYNVEFAAGLTLFRLMGQALCNVRHPNLVSVRRCLEARGTAYLVMDYIEGPNLDRLLTKEQPSGIDLEELLRAVLGALGCLHGAGLIHRDVKPANIRLGPKGVPVLVDFGATLPADLAAEPPYKSLFTSGYAAPEHNRTDTRQGPWTDLYGLAAVAYRILSGAPPPDAKVRFGGVPLVPAIEVGRGRYSEAMLASIDWALSLKAADRPQSAQEWVAALSAPIETSAASADADDMNCLPQPPTTAAADVVAQADDKADELAIAPPEAPRARRLRIWAAAVLVLMALPVAVVAGRIYYLRQIKSDWVVDARGNGDVKSLAQAMTSARTGATIHVRPGRYEEALVMARPLTIQGVGNAAEIVVVAPGPCVTITAESGAISGFTFIGGTGSGHSPGGACVEIVGASTVNLTGTVIRNVAGTGLRVGEDAAPVVRGNRIEQISGPAIVIQDRATGTITANAITAGGAPGVLIRDAAAPSVTENRIDSAVQAGILVTGESTPRIAGNHITNSTWSGLEVRGGADPAVMRNRIEGAGQAGIYVYDGGRGTYQDNIVVASAYSGVVVGAGAEPVMTGNRITGNREHGILVLARGGGRYQGNTITDNAGHGLAIDVGATPVHADNAFAGNLDPPTVIGETVVEEKPAVDEDRAPESPPPSAP